MQGHPVNPELRLVPLETLATPQTEHRPDHAAFSWLERGVHRTETGDGYVRYTAVDRLGRMRFRMEVMLHDDAPHWQMNTWRVLDALELGTPDPGGRKELRLVG